MNSIDLIKSLFIKIKLHHPIPDEFQEEIIKSRKKTLKFILKEKKSFSFHKNLVIKFYNWCKEFGISISMKGSSIFIRSASFAGAGVILFLIAFNLIISPLPISNNYITFVMGDVKVQRISMEEKKLQLNDIIKKNDVLITGIKSMAALQVRDVGIINVMENSKVAIKSILEDSKTSIDIKNGKVLSKILKQRNGDYQVGTPNCFAAVRGTEFSVYYNTAKDQSVISVTEGVVSVTHSKKMKEVSVEKNKTAIVSDDITINSIPEMEKLELKKLSPFRDYKMNKIDKKFLEKKNPNTVQEIEKIDIEIKKVKNSTGMTLSEIRKKYGVVYKVIDYQGKVQRGFILKRNKKTVRMITPSGYKNIPANMIKNVLVEK